ncbi:hypothetical protein P7C70_g6520, partial [Phenoliferia sp. Uapishka_3]
MFFEGHEPTPSGVQRVVVPEAARKLECFRLKEATSKITAKNITNPRDLEDAVLKIPPFSDSLRRTLPSTQQPLPTPLAVRTFIQTILHTTYPASNGRPLEFKTLPPPIQARYVGLLERLFPMFAFCKSKGPNANCLARKALEEMVEEERMRIGSTTGKETEGDISNGQVSLEKDEGKFGDFWMKPTNEGFELQEGVKVGGTVGSTIGRAMMSLPEDDEEEEEEEEPAESLDTVMETAFETVRLPNVCLVRAVLKIPSHPQDSSEPVAGLPTELSVVGLPTELSDTLREMVKEQEASFDQMKEDCESVRAILTSRTTELNVARQQITELQCLSMISESQTRALEAKLKKLQSEETDWRKAQAGVSRKYLEMELQLSRLRGELAKRDKKEAALTADNTQLKAELKATRSALSASLEEVISLTKSTPGSSDGDEEEGMPRSLSNIDEVSSLLEREDAEASDGETDEMIEYEAEEYDFVEFGPSEMNEPSSKRFSLKTRLLPKLGIKPRVKELPDDRFHAKREWVPSFEIRG